MSPAATVTDEHATAAILAAADELFYVNGVKSVTMADLRDRAAVSMRRLYGLFPAKSDVVAGWLRDRHHRWMHSFSSGVDSRVAEGIEPLTAVFAQVEHWMVGSSFRGCGFINTHAEASDYTAEQLDIIREHKNEFERYLADVVGDIPALAVLIDGAIVQSSIHASVEPIRAAFELANKHQAVEQTTKHRNETSR